MNTNTQAHISEGAHAVAFMNRWYARTRKENERDEKEKRNMKDIDRLNAYKNGHFDELSL